MTRDSRLAVSHQSLRSRYDGCSQSTHYGWEFVLTLIHPKSRSTDSFQQFYDWPAFEIPQQNSKLRSTSHFIDRIVANISLVLQQAGDRYLLPGQWHNNSHFTRTLTVANSRQHIRNWILHAHRDYTSLGVHSLPTGLDQPGYIATHSRLTQLVPAKAEFPVICMRSPGQSTPVLYTHRTRVSRQCVQFHLRVLSFLICCICALNDRLERLASL